ncbi:MAG TPA: ATP-binding protein [Gemmatimonadaceae bacterium]|nr:ATP-binding protein [Gemmatimonadaceae bacterium]
MTRFALPVLRPSSGALPPSLRTELLAAIALLVVAALVIGIGSVVWFADLVSAPQGAVYLTLLILADVGILVLFGAYELRRLVLRPLAAAVAAAEASAGGDLAQRVPAGSTRELAALAQAFNRTTDHLLEERARAIRNEKLASVGRLAAGVAHEVGNPLGAIGGYAHLLRGRIAGDEKAIEAVDGIERESGRIDRIVRGLLDYARPRKPTPAPADLHQAIRGASEILEQQGLLEHIELELELAECSPRLLGAGHEIEQLFVNLFLNAVDAMEGAGTLTVHTRCATAGEMLAARPRRETDPGTFVAPRDASPRMRDWLVRLAVDDEVVKVIVADTGTGVAPSDVERIFDPFYTTKEPGRGTGLGLAIVSRVVENLGGVIWVQPARGHGAAFAMLLPIRRSLAAAPAMAVPTVTRLA